MIIIGCDYHPSFQQIAFVDTETGELQERRLQHREEAEKFYRDLAAQGMKVRVGMEASGHARWFERLLAELQFELWIGDAAEISTKRVRKQKTDRQDAQLILELMLEDRFPQIWVPSWENRDLRQLLWHRHRMVQARTRIMNQLQAVALNEGLRCKKRLWRESGREQLESFRLAPWASRRRCDLLELLDRLTPTIAELTQAIEQEVEKCPAAQPSSGFESSLEKRLFSKGTRPLFRGSMKPKPGDISIVDKTGTFLLWYDNVQTCTLTTVLIGRMLLDCKVGGSL